MRVLVTGGSGFLGGAIVRKLLARGDHVRSFARSDAPTLASLGVEVMRGDLADGDAVHRAVSGCDLVQHVAAKAGYWGAREAYERTNVLGTQNVIAACRAAKIDRLVYTSTPSVIYNGADIAGADESLSYPAHYEAVYPETKARAEQLVLAANDDSLATVALRPHLIWGPGDNQLVPRLVERAHAGTLLKIGARPCLVDTVYVDNAAEAQVLAGDRLKPGSPIAGRAFFISNDEPMPCSELIDRVIDAAGLPAVQRTLPVALARILATCAETLHRLLPRNGEPQLTHFLVSQLSTAHWFDISAARKELGYDPEVSIDEGMRRLAEWLRKSPCRTEPAA
jgi:nucleoside-diphosphate-sugar epimerase